MYPFLLGTYNSLGEQIIPQTIVGGTSDAHSEVFMLSGRDESESVVKNGTFAGLGINEALARLGGEEHTPDNNFPIYIKALNTIERLPVKVYPDDEYAALHGNKKGKISLIYIADCKKGAEIVYGLSRNVSPDELKSRVKGGSLSAICNFVGVQKGDVFFVPPGVVFCLGGGISALEISTNSDSEYIISDYGRVDIHGNPRPLQIDRALDVMKTRKNNLSYGNTGELTLYPFGTVRELGVCDVFKTDLITMDGNLGLYENENLISIVFISGEVDMSYPSGTMHLKTGDSVLIPKGVKVKLSGRAEIIHTKI